MIKVFPEKVPGTSATSSCGGWASWVTPSFRGEPQPHVSASLTPGDAATIWGIESKNKDGQILPQSKRTNQILWDILLKN